MRRLMLILCSFASVSAAYAGPDKTTKYLMNTPATMFDLGIFKLSLELQRIGNNPKHYSEYPPFKKFSPVVMYDWDQDKIQIVGVFVPKSDDAEPLCKQWISDIRRYGYVDPVTGEIKSGHRKSKYARYFSHIGFVKEHAKEAIKNLDMKFQVSCIAGGRLFRAPLLGTTYSEQK